MTNLYTAVFSELSVQYALRLIRSDNNELFIVAERSSAFGINHEIQIPLFQSRINSLIRALSYDESLFVGEYDEDSDDDTCSLFVEPRELRFVKTMRGENSGVHETISLDFALQDNTILGILNTLQEERKSWK